MTAVDKFINSLIPERFKATYEDETKVRGALFVQLTFGLLLSFLGLYFGIIDDVWHELVLNTGMGVFLLASLFSLSLFNKFESYVNFILTFGYIVLGLFLIKAGGIYADAPFWFALIISVNIFYTTTKQAMFWIAVVTLFLGTMFYLQITGLDLQHAQVSFAKKAATLFSFYVLLFTIAVSFKKINSRKNSHYIDVISQHKRLLKERDDLMSIIAHDLKSPTRRIEGLLNIFESNNLTSDQKEILKRLNKTAVESKQLIDDLLEATSYQSNLKIDKTSINQIIAELKTGFLPLASKKDIRIITRGLRSKLWVETSGYQLKRILDNLLSNAIKFSPPNTLIEIICVQNNEKTSISIKDQGPGFTIEDEANMFKMFQKLSAQPTGGESSSGLGLSIVKNLSELLNAEIKYVTQVGKGSAFTLVLPNKKSQEEKV